jgi:predicted amidohydrolase YtcJ
MSRTEGTTRTSPGGHADLAFVNGAVYTVDAARSRAQAVAVRDGRIAAVGTDADVRQLVGPRTEIVDLDGRMLLPGFQDAHVHPPAGGLEMLQCNLSDAHTRADYEGLVAAYAADHPDRPWIQGGGWSMSAFPRGAPGKDVLDAIVADRPVALFSRDGHSVWVNSKALEVAGVDASTEDPPDGRIERDATGAPSGTLHEGACDLVQRLGPEPTPEEEREGLRVSQRYLHSLGITAWQDAIVGGHYDTLDLYRSFAASGELTARVVGALWWDRHRGREQVEELEAKRGAGTVGRFRATSVKIMQDGIVENFTAGCLDPYLDADGNPTEQRGLSQVDPVELKTIVSELDARGFQVHFHTIGDRAVREALDAIEAARSRNGPSDHRHHLAHIQLVHPDDVPRFRSLGAVANGQPLWACLESQMVELTIPFLGDERAAWQYPFGSLVRSGATLAFGSDWSVSSPDPLKEMHVAVNRRVRPEEIEYTGGDRRAVEEIFLPEERIDLETAIAAFTIGSAFVNHLDDETGSIEAGKLADLTVVDRDLFAHPADELSLARVDATFVEGAAVRTPRCPRRDRPGRYPAVAARPRPPPPSQRSRR